VLGRQGKTDEARAELELALEIDPRSAVARIDLARALVALGRIDEAAAQYRRVLEIAPGNRVARQSLDKLLRDNAERPNR
jgi:Tfp pilus assembly protein PilF